MRNLAVSAPGAGLTRSTVMVSATIPVSARRDVDVLPSRPRTFDSNHMRDGHVPSRDKRAC